MKLKHYISIGAVALTLLSCGGTTVKKGELTPPEQAFDSLMTYIERSGDFINSPKVPAMISASALYAKLDSNTLVLDTRAADQFAAAHIPASVNVPFNQLLNYFENKISPSSFNTIAIVCNAGQTASYATSILRHLGYSNVYALKWGFGSWHLETAKKTWIARKSGKYSDMLERTPNPKNQGSSYPAIETSHTSGYSILRERAHKLFADGFPNVTLSPDTLFKAKENFYILNYWPEPLYNVGHIPGAIQYQPKKSLKRTEQLSTLPTNKPIAVYCFTGQHSSFVTAYLRLLGYDARTLSYGANGFMHSVMVTEGIENAFSEKEILDLPVSAGGATAIQTKKVEIPAAPRGGC